MKTLLAILTIALASCATAITPLEPDPYDGPVEAPYIKTSLPNQGPPWARLYNPTSSQVLISVKCPKSLRFLLPKRTSHKFYYQPTPTDLGPSRCEVLGWEAKD